VNRGKKGDLKKTDLRDQTKKTIRHLLARKTTERSKEMSNNWEQAQQMAKKHVQSGSGLFIRLTNNGDKIIGAFVGEPLAREMHWVGDKYEECTGDGCPHCEKGKKPGLRVAINFFVPAENRMRIFEQGVFWFNDLMKVKTKYGLENWFFEMERRGQPGDSNTRYTILPETKITEEQRTQIDAMPLNELAKAVSRDTDDFDSYDREVDGTIDESTVSELMPRLKSLPRTALDAWLSKLGIERVKDLKTSDLKAAQSLLEQIETQHQSGNASSKEIDPFA